MSGYIRTGEYYPNKLESNLPCSPAASVIYENKIHILGDDRGHYSWDGTSWTQESTLPYYGAGIIAVVYNNKIHILGGTGNSNYTKHYSWNGTSWSQESNLPGDGTYDTHGDAVVYNNKIYVYDRNSFGLISWNGSTWTTEAQKYSTAARGARLVVYNNKIHFLGGGIMDGGSTEHYSWDGTSWTQESTLPYAFSGYTAIVYNNKIHILGNTDYRSSVEYINKYRYSWDGSTWKAESLLPCNAPQSSVVYNNKIHVFYDYWDSESWHEHYSLSVKIDLGTKKIKRAWFPVKSGYTESAGKPVLTFENKRVRKAWIMTANHGLKLVLKPISSYFKYFNCPVSFRGLWNRSAAVRYNGKIHVLSNQYHYSFDGSKWSLEEQTLLPFINTRNVVSVNDKINVLGTYDSSTGNYTKEHWSWDGSSWRKLVDLPITFGPDGACCVVEEKTTGNPPYIHIFLGYDHYGINPDTGYGFQVVNNPYNFHYGIVYYDPELRGLDGSIVMIGGSSTSTYANRIYHYNLNAQTVEELWVRNNYDFPERIGEGYSLAIVLYDENNIQYGNYAYVFTGFNAYRLEEGTSITSYPSALERNDIATGCALNNYLHIIMSDRDQYKSAAESIYSQGLSFSKITTLPALRKPLYQALNIGGKIHVFYGDYQDSLNNLSHYSLDNDVWSVESTSVSSESQNIYLDAIKASVSHDGNIVLIYGGESYSGGGVSVYVYDSSTEQWSTAYLIPDGTFYGQPQSVEESNRLVSYDGKLYLMGNYWGDNNKDLVAVSYTEHGISSWNIILGSTIPQEVRSGDAVVVGDKIHIINEYYGVYYHYSYDPVANDWIMESTNLPYTVDSGVTYNSKKPILGVLDNKLYALVRSRNDKNIYSLYHFKGSGWALDYDNIDTGYWPIDKMVEADGNFYMFSEHEVYKTNLENYFT